MKSAIKPNYFFDFRDVGKVENKEPEVIEEDFVAAMAHHNGWKVLKEYIENLMQELDGVNQKAMENGATFEEIGRNSIVIQLSKEMLLKVIQRVEDAREDRDTRAGQS